eukprot:66485-Hanusia_phi.AAC.1
MTKEITVRVLFPSYPGAPDRGPPPPPAGLVTGPRAGPAPAAESRTVRLLLPSSEVHSGGSDTVSRAECRVQYRRTVYRVSVVLAQRRLNTDGHGTVRPGRVVPGITVTTVDGDCQSDRPNYPMMPEPGAAYGTPVTGPHTPGPRTPPGLLQVPSFESDPTRCPRAPAESVACHGVTSPADRTGRLNHDRTPHWVRYGTAAGYSDGTVPDPTHRTDSRTPRAQCPARSF